MLRCPPEEPLTDDDIRSILVALGVMGAILVGVVLVAIALALGWHTNPPWVVRVVSGVLLSVVERLR